MSYRIDYTGLKFNMLTVIEFSHVHNTNAYWKCICDCGNYTTLIGYSIKSGHTKSCGCLHKTPKTFNRKTHGMSRTRTHTSWKSLKARCLNPNSKDYKNYGGRGIIKDLVRRKIKLDKR